MTTLAVLQSGIVVSDSHDPFTESKEEIKYKITCFNNESFEMSKYDFIRIRQFCKFITQQIEPVLLHSALDEIGG